MVSEWALPITELARRCAEEMARYRRRQPYDPTHCYEMVRRALEHRDQDAWAAVYNQYHRLVRYRLGNAPGEPDALVNQVFARFWHAIPSERFADFPNLDKLLAYLKRCTQSVAIDAVRREKRKQVHETALHLLQSGENLGIEASPTARLLDGIVADQAFEHTRKRLITHQEQVAFQASIEWDLKPAEIAERWPDLFADAREVSRVKERIFRRLQRDGELRILLGMSDDDGGKG